MSFVLFETTALSSDSPESQHIRIGTIGYSDASAPGYFEPRLKSAQAIVISQSIYPSRLAFGFADESFAVVQATNSDGFYDDFAAYGFGQQATIKLGEDGVAYGALQTVFNGRITGVNISRATADFVWRSRYDVLDDPISPSFFLGNNNDSPNERLEGKDDGIGGQRKKRAGGKLYNIEPVIVNAAFRVLGWAWDKDGNRNATHSIDEVRVNGSVWTFSTDYATPELLLANDPGVGNYNTCKAESLILMGGSNPLSGTVRIDVTIESNAADRQAGALAKVLIEEAGLSTNAASFTALATDAGYEAGYYADEQTYRDVINGLLGSVLAYGYLNNGGEAVAGRLVNPADETPVATLRRMALGEWAQTNDIPIFGIEPLIARDDDLGAPAREVSVRYYQNWAPLDFGTIAAAVDDAEKLQLSNQYRNTQPVDNIAIASQFANAVDVTHDTWLMSLVDAEAIRDDLADMLGKLERRYQVRARLTPSLASTVSLGSVVKIYYDRFGFDSGVNAQVVGLEIDASQRNAVLEVRL